MPEWSETAVTGALAFGAGAAAVYAWTSINTKRSSSAAASAEEAAAAQTKPQQQQQPEERRRIAKDAPAKADDVLITEQLSRNTMFYGEANQKQVS